MVIRGGASLVRYQPAFSNDGKRLLVCKSALVTVYSTATSLPVLHLSGHKDAVTTVIVVPASITGDISTNHCWTASMDGTVRFWDFSTDAPPIKSIVVGRPIVSMVIPSLLRPPPKEGEKASNMIAYLSLRWLKEGHEPRLEAVEGGKVDWHGRVKVYDLTKSRYLQGSLIKTITPQALSVSPFGSFVGLTWNRKVHVWRVPSTYSVHVRCITLTTLHHTKTCRVVTFDPTERVVAAGDDTGRILCWQSVGERRLDQIVKQKGSPTSVIPKGPKHSASGVRGNDDAESCTTYHWHANAVQSLCFSVDGTYLFSGGSEGTLVIWQPETGKQQYRPRLGGPLVYITQSKDPSVFAISCLDNTIKFINLGTTHVEKCFQGIRTFTPLPDVLKWVSNTRALFEPKDGKLAFPTDHMGLQFYDPVRDTHLAEVQIAPRTYVGADFKKNLSESGPSTFVTHVAFSSDGSIMATIDICLPEEDIGGSATLKFWDRHARRLSYTLSTVVNDPHGADITSMVYHPSRHILVTCSVDATFKVWVQSSDFKVEDDYETVTGWRCRSVGSYRHKQMLAVAFSPDGSLLAAAAEELVTLWNPYTNGFVTSLASVPSPQKIRHLAFVHKSPFLVAASTEGKPRMTVWHLPTLSVRWSSLLYVEALAVDPRNSVFSIIALTGPPSMETKDGYEDAANRKAVVAVFNSEDPTPIAAWSIREGRGGTLMFSNSNLLRAQEEVNGSEDGRKPDSCLAVLTGSREYVLFNPLDKKVQPEVFALPAPQGPEEGPSAFSALYGKAATPKIREPKDVLGMRAARPWGDLLNAPSHVLPSLTRISYAFMESLLEKQTDTDDQRNL
ncbi:hypothetical protein Mapa_011866 [Marchantia paleacea]|nr:hypothetical protein Mapa_011866 [Marchantia paleacea]